ncbi:MAG TPA: S8 family serine peptidase [Bacteroidales bacterium]
MRKRTLLYLILLLLSCSVQAINDALRFRVFLRDKKDESASLPVPELSQASLARRENQGIVFDSTDYPLSGTYLKAIREAGYPIVSKSHWMNTVVISAPDSTCIDKLKTFSFVRDVQLVWVNPLLKQSTSLKFPVNKEINQSDSSSYYGKAADQVGMLGLETLHDMGFKGGGKTIAIVDAGFYGVDTMSWFKNVSITVAKDFIYPPSSVFTGHSHGTSVLSTMASKEAYSFVGTAPDAKYCLLRSEDVLSEFPIEEDYWVAAVEYADSIGADIVTCSLGYTVFDLPILSHKKNQLDGKTAFVSRGAAIAARKGILVVCSAGNDGGSAWKKIDFPADVDQVLTVGSVQSDLTRSSFSSSGPTFDGRIKPDVMALGSGTSIINGNGLLTTGSGTSYSTPLVAGMAACIWGAMPQLKSTELLQYIRESGMNASTPDTLYGYGIPNAEKIWISLNESLPQADVPKFYCYPNPVKDLLYFADFSLGSAPVKVVIFNSFGQKLLEKNISGNHSYVDVSGFPDSIYMIEFLVSGVRKACQKIVIHK